MTVPLLRRVYASSELAPIPGRIKVHSGKIIGSSPNVSLRAFRF
jgi:hypothetical protein